MVDFKKGIDTSKLSGDWEKWAKEADKKGNKDGKYLNSAFEFNYVKDKAYQEVQNGSMQQKDMASVFGDMNTNKAISDGEMANILAGNDIQDSVDPATKTDKKAHLQTVKDDVSRNGASYFQPKNGSRKLEDPIDWTKVADDLKNQYKGESVDNPEYYAKLCDEVDKVAKLMTPAKNYNSRKDVSFIYNTVKDELDKINDKEFKDFRKNILKEFVKIAEEHQKAKEKAQVEARYNELATKGLTYVVQGSKDVPGNEITKPLTRTEIAEQLEKEFKGKGSYFESYYNIDQAEKFDKKADVMYNHKGLVSEVINSKIQAGADNLVARTILSLRKPTKEELQKNPKLLDDFNEKVTKYGLEKFDLTNGKDIEKAAKQVLEKQGQSDKYTDKAFSGRGTKLGERSQVKGERYWIAAINRVEGIKSKLHTREEFYDVLKDDTVFQQLAKNGTLISQKGDNQYDISALSNLIRDVVSKTDYTLNKGNESEYAELNNLIREINKKTGVTVSEKDAKRLVDFCGFDRDKKDLAKILADMAKGAIGGIIPGLVNFGTSQILQNFLDTSQNIVVNTVANSVVNTSVDVSKINQRLYSLMVPINVNGQAIIDTTIAIMPTMTDADGNSVDVVANYNKSYIKNALRAQGYDSEIVQNGNAISIHITGTVSGDPQQAMVKLGDLLENHFEIKSEDIDVTTDVQTEVNTDTSGSSAEVVRKPWRDFAWVMGMNMALAALQEAFAEMPGENPVLSWEVAADDFQTYVKDLQSNQELSPKMKEAVALMADSFRDAEGNWMPQEFENFLKEIAGGGKSSADGSKLRTGKINLHELHNGILDRLNNIKVVPKKTEPEPVEQKQTITPQKTEPVKAVEKFAAIKEEDNVDGTHTSWSKISEIYGDALPKDPKLRTRMLKVMQGMNGDKLTLEQLQTLAELSMKNIRNVKHLPAPNSQYMDPKDYAKKAKEAFKDVEFLEDYNFNYEVFASNVCLGSLGDENNKLILPKVLYKDDNDQEGIKRLKEPDRETRKAYTSKGSNGRSVKKSGKAGHVGDGKVNDGKGTRRTSASDAQSKIKAGTHIQKKYDEM